ncbi:hypothetical protein [Sphingomonas bacterium]|uniref:hypothetical protein n=1 Tax=Sphingomonas bacterium TaxID=1895847 RepID=UPI00157677BD|nr:hypothetical protein [Sphingomonas bacterium]
MTIMTAPLTNARDVARHTVPSFPTFAATSIMAYMDPLDEDEPSDDVVVTTRRAISRVALVASEAAGRFQREGVAHDPMTWMLAPRVLFSGATALDACLERGACLRGILLHGLSIGLDAEPAAIDALASDDDEDEDIDFTGVEFERGYGHGGEGELSPFDRDQGEPRLFTATVIANDGFEIVQAFHASLASDESEIAGRLYMRMGAAMADAVIVEGFDPTAPLVGALVSKAICHTLALIASDPASPLAAGIDLNIEQRFLA